MRPFLHYHCWLIEIACIQVDRACSKSLSHIHWMVICSKYIIMELNRFEKKMFRFWGEKSNLCRQFANNSNSSQNGKLCAVSMMWKDERTSKKIFVVIDTLKRRKEFLLKRENVYWEECSKMVAPIEIYIWLMDKYGKIRTPFAGYFMHLTHFDQ